MHERTFILSILALDVMFIAGGGVMAWLRALPRLPLMKASSGADPLTAVMSTLLIAGIGGWAVHQLNLFVFRLAESGDAERIARWIALAYTCAAMLGGAAGIARG